MADTIHIPLSPAADTMLDWLSLKSGLSRRKVINQLLEQLESDVRISRARGMLSHALYMLRDNRPSEAEAQIIDALEELK